MSLNYYYYDYYYTFYGLLADRAALMEFEINMAEMPLGKLSKRHIERGLSHLSSIPV